MNPLTSLTIWLRGYNEGFSRCARLLTEQANAEAAQQQGASAPQGATPRTTPEPTTDLRSPAHRKAVAARAGGRSRKRSLKGSTNGS